MTLAYWNRPCAAKGLTSYRYPSPLGGWVMIGASSVADAVREANRSLSPATADITKLQVWNGEHYISAV
jgi:hypothetical protein